MIHFTYLEVYLEKDWLTRQPSTCFSSVTLKADWQLAEDLTATFWVSQVGQGESYSKLWQWLWKASSLGCSGLPPSHPVSHRRSTSNPAQAGLGFSMSKSHYQPLSHYQTKLNIYKAPGSRVHIFFWFVYSLEEQSPCVGLQPFAGCCNTAPWVPVPICRSWQNAAGNAERPHGHWEIGRSES